MIILTEMNLNMQTWSIIPHRTYFFFICVFMLLQFPKKSNTGLIISSEATLNYEMSVHLSASFKISLIFLCRFLSLMSNYNIIYTFEKYYDSTIFISSIINLKT